MASIVARTRDGSLILDSIPELKDYCYIVAGIVGEMLSELFLLNRPALSGIAAFLRERAAIFGEALQLVNILKDSAVDAQEGRRYLPADVPKAEVFTLARGDLRVAGEYIRALQSAGAPRGLIEFTALPVQLAWAALERVEKHGPGSKVSRPEVFLITQRLKRALDRESLPRRTVSSYELRVSSPQRSASTRNPKPETRNSKPSTPPSVPSPPASSTSSAAP